MLRRLIKGYSLGLVSLVEMAAPFLRMLALSRTMTLVELGMVSALAATISAFEQVTDFAIYRSVFSVPRDEYDDALAAAHGLAILRGLVVGVLAALAAPLVAAAFGIGVKFHAFALLGPVIAIRGLEHLSPRVAERDYNYGLQLKISLAGNAVGLAALGIGLFFTRSYVAFLISIYAQALVQVAASHLVAADKYRVAFFTPHFAKAFRFGYPLMFNGFGLAASSQGDRFLIGALLGLPSLAIYAVITLATTVPFALVSRVTGPVVLAQLYNAADGADGSYVPRLRLSARILPLVASFYALGVIALLNIAMPVVFGAKFTLTPAATAFLGLAIFARVARGDPFSSMLLHVGRTKRLAVANLSSASALAFELVLLLIFRNFEAAMAGRLCGEIVAMIVTLFVTRDLFRPARADYAKAVTVGAVVLAVAIGLGPAGVGVHIGPSIAAVLGGLAILVVWAASFTPAMLDASFPALRRKA